MGLIFVGPNGIPIKMGVEERVLERIEFEPEFGHWLWCGNLTPKAKRKDGEPGKGGYGRISFRDVVGRAVKASIAPEGSTDILAHRYVYWCYHGSIPVDPLSGISAILDHDMQKCHGRPHHCCCPQHMTPVTPRLNTARGIHARKHEGQGSLLVASEFEDGLL